MCDVPKQRRKLTGKTLSVYLFDHRLERLPHVVRDNPLACDIRMNFILLIERIDPRNTVQQKGNHGHVRVSGSVRVSVPEL
jgi:hypothetical protein